MRKPRILLARSFSGGDPSDLSDTFGHGTAVAGIAAAQTNNSDGIAGVCPGCKAMIFKAFTGKSERSWCSLVGAEAIKAAVDSGAHVVNFSAGTYCDTIRHFWEDVIHHADTSDCLIINAAANDSSLYTNGFPEMLAIVGTDRYGHECGYPNVIPVAATDCSDMLAQFSGWGPMIGVVAPGGTGGMFDMGASDILAPHNAHGDSVACSQSYRRRAGCSFAAPHVTGLVGLVRSMGSFPDSIVRKIILCSADQIDAENYPYDEPAVCWDYGSGSATEKDTLDCWGSPRLRNDKYGYGRINAYRAVALADSFFPTNAEAESTSRAQITSSIHLCQNHPNPFNPTTEVRFYLPSAGFANLTIYNVHGQRLRTLIDGKMAQGMHVTSWDGTGNSGRHVRTGVYFLHLRAANQQRTTKLVLME